MLFIWWFFSGIQTTGCTVLDPALYLSPSPPLIPITNNDPKILWTQSIKPDSVPEMKIVEPDNEELIEKQDSLEEADTIWPRTSFSFPFQFHLSGTYGGYRGTGAISSSYASISDNRHFGKPFAGSSYGHYGNRPNVKLFGGNEGATWTGWGNGKWGHYGKGK